MHSISLLESTNKGEFPLTKFFSNTSSDSIAYQPLVFIFPRKNFNDKLFSKADQRMKGRGLALGAKKQLKVDEGELN